MLIRQFDENGRRRHYQRRMLMCCHVCAVRIEPPDGVEQFGWLKGVEATSFLERHRSHGDETTAGWHFEFKEIGDDE